MRKWGIYCLADGEMLPSLYASEQEAWEAIEESGADVDFAPVPVLLGSGLPNNVEAEAQKALAVFKVEFLNSKDFEARNRDPDATVTVLVATVRAEDHDDAMRKACELFRDAVVLATYKCEPTEEGLTAAVWPQQGCGEAP